MIRGDLTMPGICEDYIYGKHTTHPYDATVEPKGTPNNHMHIDLWGLASVTLMRGSSYLSVFFLTRKDLNTTLTAFTFHHTESEHQTGRKL